MSDTTGGPAFPRQVRAVKQYDGDFQMEGSGGMSLRDWFAGQALGAAFADHAAVTEGEIDLEYVAASAYALADAMLAERRKP